LVSKNDLFLIDGYIEVRELVFGLASLASFFAMIASIIHFQIFGALIFFILGMILFMIADTR
jgi:hypothetical protein